MIDNRIYDYFGKQCTELQEKKLFLFDMDGTIYTENRLFEGAKEFFELLNARNKSYVFITNNSSKSVVSYIEKLNVLGIETKEKDFFTSSQVAIHILKQYHALDKIYCMGTKSLIDELRHHGLNVTSDVEEGIGAILVGFDLELTSAKIRKTCELLQRDIPFYATNCDLVCPVEFGFIPDCGSICQMLANATGRTPIFLGKPEPAILDILVDKFCVEIEDIVVIGDRLYTDIALGINAGVTAVCVLTGEATEEEIVAGEIKPTYTFTGIDAMLKNLIAGFT